MRLRHVLAVLMLCIASAARADSFSSAAVSTFTIAPSADTLAMSATSSTVVPGGTVTLTGSFTLGDSGQLSQAIPFTFQDSLTLNGITQIVTFSATDNVTPQVDTLTIAGQTITIGGDTIAFAPFSVAGSNVGQVLPVSLTGTETAATPEIASIFLVGTGLLLMTMKGRRGSWRFARA